MFLACSPIPLIYSSRRNDTPASNESIPPTIPFVPCLRFPTTTLASNATQPHCEPLVISRQFDNGELCTSAFYVVAQAVLLRRYLNAASLGLTQLSRDNTLHSLSLKVTFVIVSFAARSRSPHAFHPKAFVGTRMEHSKLSRYLPKYDDATI